MLVLVLVLVLVLALLVLILVDGFQNAVEYAYLQFLVYAALRY